MAAARASAARLARGLQPRSGGVLDHKQKAALGRIVAVIFQERRLLRCEALGVRDNRAKVQREAFVAARRKL
jgi:hypothetical protein